MRRRFEPFDEQLDPKHLQWAGEDETDKMIPKDQDGKHIEGFITDLIYATRGREISTMYGIWSALYLISSVIQRDAWLMPPDGDPWLDKDYLNFYLLLVGPPGSGKTSAVNLVQKVLSKCNQHYRDSDDPFFQRKACAEISDVSTPEAFLGTLARHSRNDDGSARKVIVGLDRNKNVSEVKAISNGNITLSEFASLLGRKNYSEGMSTHLLQLYDSPSMFRWNTVKRGLVLIPDVYLNIIGASTQDGMTSSVNPAVLEDGFMSRVIMCYVPTYGRKRPDRYQTGCSLKVLSQRLLWISKYQKGAFKLDHEAHERYYTWYSNFIDKMNKNTEKAGYLIRNRTLVLKVAALLKMSEYTPGNVIAIRHLEAAFKLIDQTYSKVADLLEYFTDSQVGAAKKALKSVLLLKRGGVSRRQIANKITRYRKDAVEAALQELYLQGYIRVINAKGEEQEQPLFYPEERYIYERAKANNPNLDFGDEESSTPRKSKKPVPKRNVRTKNSKESSSITVADLFDIT